MIQFSSYLSKARLIRHNAETNWKALTGFLMEEAKETDDGADEPLGEAGKRALDAERKERKKYERAYKDMQKKYGTLDLNEVEEMRGKLDEYEATQMQTKNDWAGREAKLKGENDKKVQSLQQEIEQYKKLYESALVDSQLTEAFFNAGGRRPEGESDDPKGFASMLIPQIRKQVEVVDGQIIAKDADGSEISIQNLMANARKGATAVLFESENQGSGSGAPPRSVNGKRGNSMSGADWLKMAPADRIAKAREMGINQ